MSQPNADRYLNLMLEAKHRIFSIDQVLSGKCNLGFLPTNTETVYLQFRKILELVAYASLVANIDIYTAARKDHSTEWHAKRFLKKIDSLNPHFYPDALRHDPVDGNSLNYESVDAPYLSRADFEILYDTCGALMHSENPYGGAHQYSTLLKDAPAWLEKIGNLLDVHHIRLVDGSSWLMHLGGEGHPFYMVLDKV